MTTTTVTKERGIIVRDGMGGLMNPPTHPEHTHSVQYDPKRSRDNRSTASLSYAVTCEFLDDEIRAASKRLLDEWQRPPLDSEEVQAWVKSCLAFWKNCYENGEGRNVDKLLIIKRGDDIPPMDRHAGVLHIRDYYPEYEPKPEDFLGGTFPVYEPQVKIDRVAEARERIAKDRYRTIAKAHTEAKIKLWTLENIGPDMFNNVIYYSHTGRVAFAWYEKLGEKAVSALLDKISEFPHPYDIICADGRKLSGE